MEIQTKLFGTIAVDENKVIRFDNGIIGFPSLNRFLLIYDEEKKDKDNIYWLQSVDEPTFSLPVLDPLLVMETYNPTLEDELLKSISLSDQEEMLVFTTVTVPSDYTKMTVNLKAPLLINTTTKKGCQIIIENEEYPVKYPVYDILSAKQEGKGE